MILLEIIIIQKMMKSERKLRKIKQTFDLIL
jgi:hypothetical protein